MNAARNKPSAPRRIGVNDNTPKVANDNSPVVILLGDLPLVSRHPIDRLSPGELARVNRIEAALRGRRKAEASRLALDYERSQGITTEERIEAMAPANDLDALLENALVAAMAGYAETYSPPKPKREKRPKGHKRVKVKTPDPLEGLRPGDLTQDEINRLEVAEGDLKSLDVEVVNRAKTAIRKIREAADRREVRASLDAARAEMEELERLRDPDVSFIPTKRQEHSGRIELSNRDGLEALWIEGKLTDAERARGRRYRDWFEQSAQSLRSNADAIRSRMMSAGGGSGGDRDEPDTSVALDRVLAMESAVKKSSESMVEVGRRLLCLREVAGKGHTIRQVAGGSGKGHTTHMLSLKAALNAIP